MDTWNSDAAFGFKQESAGGNMGVASAPTAVASSALKPHPNAIGALLDPKGSGIFWLALAAILGLAMVTFQLKIGTEIKSRAGKK